MSKPWTAVPYGDLAYTIVDVDNREVAYVRQCEEVKANALVLAAAPELLKSLRDILSWTATDVPPTIESQARAAIAKAEGRL